MTSWKHYHRPHDMAEALALLRRYGEEARIIAGGTDLILDLEFGREKAVRALVDITAIRDLDRIEEKNGWIEIGAAATHAAIASHPLIRRHAAALAEGSGVIGGPQVRNVATIGGNVAHALPAADGTTALMALDAQVLIHSADAPDGGEAKQWKPLREMFVGPGENSLTTGQMIGAVRIPCIGARRASAFDRIMRPQGIALPMLGFAASVELEEASNRIAAVRLCFGPAGPVPFRASTAEERLIGRLPDEKSMSEAVAAALEQASFRTSRHRASQAYRQEMVEVLMRRVLRRAWENAAGGQRAGFGTVGGASQGSASTVWSDAAAGTARSVPTSGPNAANSPTSARPVPEKTTTKDDTRG